MVEHGVTPEALAAYDDKLCGPISQLVLRNRGAGPFGLLNMVDERCGGTFDNIDDVIPAEERASSWQATRPRPALRSRNSTRRRRQFPMARAPVLLQGTPHGNLPSIVSDVFDGLAGGLGFEPRHG